MRRRAAYLSELAVAHIVMWFMRPHLVRQGCCAVQGRTAAQVCGGEGGTVEAAAQRLPLLYELLASLAQGRWFKQLELLCSMLQSLRGPPWLKACIASWPLAIADEHSGPLVRPEHNCPHHASQTEALCMYATTSATMTSVVNGMFAIAFTMLMHHAWQ